MCLPLPRLRSRPARGLARLRPEQGTVQALVLQLATGPLALTLLAISAGALLVQGILFLAPAPITLAIFLPEWVLSQKAK